MQGRKQHAHSSGRDLQNRESRVIDQQTPLKFWEIDHFFKCPVVGMCLTLSEQKQILKKTGYSVQHKSPFELHEILVASSESEGRLSRKIDNLLNRKFGKEAMYLLELDHETLRGHFKAAFESGDCNGVLWAAAIYPNLPIELKREIFGDIHMAMHWSGEQNLKMKRKLARQEKQIDGLHRRSKAATRHRRSVQKENMRLKKSQSELRTTLVAIERENVNLEKALATSHERYRYCEIEKENRTLKAKLNALATNVKDDQHRMALLEKKNLRLTSEIERQQDSNNRFRKEAQRIIGEVFTLNRCDAACPSFNLCKKHNKPVHMLANASLNAVSQIIWGIKDTGAIN